MGAVGILGRDGRMLVQVHHLPYTLDGAAHVLGEAGAERQSHGVVGAVQAGIPVHDLAVAEVLDEDILVGGAVGDEDFRVGLLLVRTGVQAEAAVMDHLAGVVGILEELPGHGRVHSHQAGVGGGTGDAGVLVVLGHAPGPEHRLGHQGRSGPAGTAGKVVGAAAGRPVLHRELQVVMDEHPGVVLGAPGELERFDVRGRVLGDVHDGHAAVALRQGEIVERADEAGLGEEFVVAGLREIVLVVREIVDEHVDVTDAAVRPVSPLAAHVLVAAAGGLGGDGGSVSLLRLPHVTRVPAGGAVVDIALSVTGILVGEILDGHVAVQERKVFLDAVLGVEQQSLVDHTLGLQIHLVAGGKAHKGRCRKNQYVDLFLHGFSRT